MNLKNNELKFLHPMNMITDLSKSIELFQASGIERLEGYIPFKNKGRIDATCLKPCSNISTFEIVKGFEDLTLEEFDINTAFKLTKEEEISLLKQGLTKEEYNSYKEYISLFALFDKLDTIMTYSKIKKLDYTLYLEEKYYKIYIRDLMRIKNPLNYWELSEELINDYPYAWISSLNNWETDYIYKERFMEKTIPDFIKDLYTNKTRSELKNVWIESPKGKWRMLSIPNYQTRWICRMWNEVLSNYVYKKINKNFHGFIHNKGVLSWWTMFLKEKYFSKYEYIFEFDLASFFPNVNRQEALNALLHYNVPHKYAVHLIKLVSGRTVNSTHFPNSSSFYEETLNKEWSKGDRNLPMGNALCPLISSLVLYKHFEELGLNISSDIIVTGYADDNSLMLTRKGYEQLCLKLGKTIINEIDITNYLNDRWKGIIIEPAKSGWVKKDGKWLKNYKNLGMLYDTKDLFASTRGTKHGPSHLKLYRKNNLKDEILNLEYILNNSKFFDDYFGFLQSRLFQNNWNPKYPQDFSLQQLTKKSLLTLAYNKFNIKNNYNKTNTIFDNYKSIFNGTSYCNAYLIREIMKLKIKDKNIRIMDSEITWTNNLTEFKKLKDIKLNELKFSETYGFYLWKENYDNKIYDLEKKE